MLQLLTKRSSWCLPLRGFCFPLFFFLVRSQGAGRRFSNRFPLTRHDHGSSKFANVRGFATIGFERERSHFLRRGAPIAPRFPSRHCRIAKHPDSPAPHHVHDPAYLDLPATGRTVGLVQWVVAGREALGRQSLVTVQRKQNHISQQVHLPQGSKLFGCVLELVISHLSASQIETFRPNDDQQLS
jgi:hypothetical protein